jgi:hypothetical protein
MGMGLLAVIVILIAGAVLFIWPMIKARAVPAHMLGDEELETSWVDLKSKLLVTPAFTSETAYQLLYHRMESLLVGLMGRHQHFILGIEAKWGDACEREIIYLFSRDPRLSAAQSDTFSVDARMKVEDRTTDQLLYVCWFAYVGGQPKGIPGPVFSDSRFFAETIDYLIADRQSMDAMFLKGFALKYGLKLADKPELAGARQCLETAAAAGVGSAAQELRYFDKHLPLESIKSVQIVTYVWKTATDAAELES